MSIEILPAIFIGSLIFVFVLLILWAFDVKISFSSSPKAQTSIPQKPFRKTTLEDIWAIEDKIRFRYWCKAMDTSDQIGAFQLEYEGRSGRELVQRMEDLSIQIGASIL